MNKIFQFILDPLFRSKRIPAVSSDPNFRSNLFKQFSHNRLGLFSLRFLIGFILVALLADIIANDKPLAAKYQGSIYFPVFRSYAVDLGLANWQSSLGRQDIDWKSFNTDWAVFPLIPYLACCGSKRTTMVFHFSY